VIHVDTNVIIDVTRPVPAVAAASEAALRAAARAGAGVSLIVYAELAVGIADRRLLDVMLARFGLTKLGLPEDAFYLAARAYADYRLRGGPRTTTILADFLVGGHAQAVRASLLTRAPMRYRTAFPQLTLITP